MGEGRCSEAKGEAGDGGDEDVLHAGLQVWRRGHLASAGTIVSVAG
jgi:hypothetical protein